MFKSKSALVLLIVLITILAGGCRQNNTTATTTPLVDPTITPVSQEEPTVPPDIEVSIDAATLVKIDFENEYTPEIISQFGIWNIVQEGENSIYCNEINEQWSNFIFGLEDWSDYAISLKVKFQPTSPERTLEAYIRIDNSFEGYRAVVGENDWVNVAHTSPWTDLGGAEFSVALDEWFVMQVQFAGNQLKYLLNDELMVAARDGYRDSGFAGFGVGSNTTACVDDILVWAIDESGDPVESPPELVVKPIEERFYTIDEKVENRPTIPVFYPWSGSSSWTTCAGAYHWDCDSEETPYSLVWIGAGFPTDLESTTPMVTDSFHLLMSSDPDTLYLVSEEWHYYGPWRTLSTESKFYLDEVFGYHEDSEYSRTMMINFEHPEWPGLMAEKALAYKEAGFDGMMLDWWHDYAGNGRPPEDVRAARLAIAQAIREKVGDDFILLGNVNDGTNDPTAQYLSGVFMEMYKPNTDTGYAHFKSQEGVSTSFCSIERMEDLLKYWDENLLPPRIIAFEPWKITTGDYIEDRMTEENYEYARLFTAMVLVIPENGYILYADNNDDWSGGDHQHAYYDFYHTDLGKPTSGMIDVQEGVAYKLYEKGVVAYNRTEAQVEVALPGGTSITIGPFEGVFIEEE